MFNPQSRWDRELPHSTEEKLDAPIDVYCLFNKERLIPKSFCWHKRVFHVRKINFFWKDKKGREELYFFSLKTSCGTYEVVFSKNTLSWRLRRLTGP